MAATHAQDSLPPLKSPLMRRAPAFSSWTIQFSYKEDDKQKAGGSGQTSNHIMGDRVQGLTITKTNDTYHEQRTWMSGIKEEKWIFGGFQLKLVPGKNVVVPIPPPTPDVPQPDYSDYSHGEFEKPAWLSLEIYKGVQSYQGKSAYVFESVISGKKCTAILSAAQLPLYITDGETTQVYVYNPPPTSPLTPPENFLRVLEIHKKGIQELTRHYSPP